MRVTVPAQRIRHQRAKTPGRRSLYFAYGSNLNVAHMERRCPRAEPVTQLYLQHMALLFRGVADVTPRRRSEVPGGLWWITPECERSLDSYEGVWSRVYLKRFFTASLDGQLEDVLLYQMQTHRGIMPPSQAYLQTIVDGYCDFGLDPEVLDLALQEAWGGKDVTPMLRERHQRRGRPTLARSVPPPEPYENDDFVLSEEDLREAGAT